MAIVNSNSAKRCREDSSAKYGLSASEWEKLGESLMASLADQFIADGVINSKGKTKRVLALETMRIARKHVDEGREFWVMPGYDIDILATAKQFFRKGRYRESCLFYATWFEHRVNFIITRQRFALTEDEKLQMVREVSLLGKLTWLLPALGLKRIAPSQLKVIRRVVEVRNAFVHFKYKPTNPELEDEESKRLKLLLNKVEKARCYLQEYEEKNLYDGLKGFFHRGIKTKEPGKLKAK